jgi:hypothetical protein
MASMVELSRDDARTFALAGNAIFTIESATTGVRFTYRVRKGKDKDAPYFVGVLTGPDNTADYTYLGTIFGGTDYRHGRKSTILQDAPSARAFAWLWAVLRGDKSWPDALHFYHVGRCGQCGRVLTVPESIARGLGPECSGQGYSKPHVKAKRVRAVAQPTPAVAAHTIAAEGQGDDDTAKHGSKLDALRARWTVQP